MPMRLLGKSIKMTIRSRRRFIIFTSMYTALMVWMSLSFQSFLTESGDNYIFAVAVFFTVVLSILYAWLVINYRKKEIATLKCIGYTNKNIRVIIMGELLFVTMVSFVVVIEFLIHVTYVIANTDLVLQINIEPLTVIYVLCMFIVSQFIGMTLMYRKILQLRPIVALRVLK